MSTPLPANVPPGIRVAVSIALKITSSVTVLKTDKDHTRSVTRMKFKQRYVSTMEPGLHQLPNFLVGEHYQRAFFVRLPYHPLTRKSL